MDMNAEYALLSSMIRCAWLFCEILYSHGGGGFDSEWELLVQANALQPPSGISITALCLSLISAVLHLV